jgi:hypothetical protein
LRACLSGLEFDTLSLSGDEQPLMLRDKPSGRPCPGQKDPTRSCRYGPRAKIEPEAHAHLQDAAAMQQGRIIARIFLLRGESETYPKFGLVPGDTTYWWVQHDGKSGRSAYITRSSTSDSVSTLLGTLEVYRRDSTAAQALARWIWDLDDEKTEGSCGSAGSCR